MVCCSFKTGKELSVLFDVKNTMGCKIDGFDDYVLSPDGKRMLIQTKTERIYRRSFKADFYIYNIESRRLDRLPLVMSGSVSLPPADIVATNISSAVVARRTAGGFRT